MDASFRGFRSIQRRVIHGNRGTTAASTLNRKTIPNTLCCLFDDSEGKVILKLEKHTVFWCFEMMVTDTLEIFRQSGWWWGCTSRQSPKVGVSRNKPPEIRHWSGIGCKDWLFITWNHATDWLGIKFPGAAPAGRKRTSPFQEGSCREVIILKSKSSSPCSYFFLCTV